MTRVVVTFATNEHAVEKLARLLAPQAAAFDEWVWVSSADLTAASQRVAHRDGLRVRVEPAPEGGPFAACTDPAATYLCLAESVAWLAPEFCRVMFEYREARRGAFLVHANAVGSPGLAFVHHRLGVVPGFREGRIGSTDPDDAMARGEHWSAACHRAFLGAAPEDRADRGPWTFDTWVLHDHELVPLHAVSWFGRHFEGFGGRTGCDPRTDLCRSLPRQWNMQGVVCGRALCAVLTHDDPEVQAGYAALVAAPAEPAATPAEPAAAVEPAAAAEPATPPPVGVTVDGPPAAPRKRAASRRKPPAVVNVA